MIIGITGTLAAGKGTVVEYLELKGFKHYSTSGYITEEVVRREMPINRDSMILVGNDLRAKYGPGFIAEECYKKAKELGGNSIIESIRTEGEIEVLKKKEEFYLLSVDANQDIRYFRAVERKSSKDSVDFETFKKTEKTEMTTIDPTKQNLSRCIELSDFKLRNNGTVEELYSKIEAILKEINKIPHKHSGRKDCLSWDEYFMGVALLSAKRSKDPSTQVGACIVDENKKIVGTGYNGAPRGIKDEDFPWEKEGDFMDTKYAYVCHSELNAILNSTKESLKNCTMYVGLFPCNECAKAIIQSGIKKVVYVSDKYSRVPAFMASRRILEMSNVDLIQMKSETKEIKLEFDKI